MTALRAAVIGCGAISGNHLKNIPAAGGTVCALCDPDRAAAEKRAAEFGLSVPIYADFAALLEQEKPDVVHICTPHYLHAEMIVAALEQGIHVLCEKPLAIREAQLRTVLEAERKSTAKLGVCLQNRYEANFLKLKDYADHGVLGAAGTVIWDRDAAYYASGAWRGKWATEGGGVMINQALHTLDLLQWLCGMPTHVTAHCANDLHQGVIEVEDTASAVFETETGRFNFFATTACGASFPAQVQLRTARKETVIASGKCLTVNGQVESGEAEAADGKAVWGSGHRKLIDHFYRCLQSGEKFPIDGPEAAKVVRLVLAMYRSEGERIKIEQEE